MGYRRPVARQYEEAAFLSGNEIIKIKGPMANNSYGITRVVSAVFGKEGEVSFYY